MFLNRQDIEKITGVLKKFPDVDTFELTEENSSGIGSFITMTFAQEINGVHGSFDVEISGVENW